MEERSSRKRMSFAKTTTQMYEKTKTVTRRDAETWKALKAGTELVAVEKAQGLKKGEKQVVIGTIRVTAVYLEKLIDMSPDHPAKEGFPDWTVDDFVDMFVKLNRCDADAAVRVIEFEHC